MRLPQLGYLGMMARVFGWEFRDGWIDGWLGEVGGSSVYASVTNALAHDKKRQLHCGGRNCRHWAAAVFNGRWAAASGQLAFHLSAFTPGDSCDQCQARNHRTTVASPKVEYHLLMLLEK